MNILRLLIAQVLRLYFAGITAALQGSSRTPREEKEAEQRDHKAKVNH